ncbi:GyrI-like domain-containing protein [Spongiivirga sp. MCCC 1A20706]|uniref:GyrI-like domain-containing protein n=1 Tax=Spongiivirga sp. MCCC 1A20706 TaxID=3160963 RepID=UPI0039778DAB
MILTEPKITTIPKKLLAAVSVRTSIEEFGMPRAWQQLMPKRNEITNTVSNNRYSIQVYDQAYDYKTFTPYTQFTYIAGIEVSDQNMLPEGIEPKQLVGGLYAVFNHKGTMTQFRKTLQYIHQEWLPQSIYQLDHRNHFEVLGDTYLGHDNPNSEEEVWVPIKKK